MRSCPPSSAAATGRGRKLAEQISARFQSSELNDAILEIASGNREHVKDQYHSNIREYARKIRW